VKLPVDEVAKQPEEKLQRQFIHHVLLMIDQTVAAETVYRVLGGVWQPLTTTQGAARIRGVGL